MRYSRATTTTTEMVVVSDVPPVTKEAIAAIARMVVNEAIVGTVVLYVQFYTIESVPSKRYRFFLRYSKRNKLASIKVIWNRLNAIGKPV